MHFFILVVSAFYRIYSSRHLFLSLCDASALSVNNNGPIKWRVTTKPILKPINTHYTGMNEFPRSKQTIADSRSRSDQTLPVQVILCQGPDFLLWRRSTVVTSHHNVLCIPSAQHILQTPHTCTIFSLCVAVKKISASSSQCKHNCRLYPTAIHVKKTKTINCI